MLKMAKEQDGKNDSCELDQMELLNHSFETLDQREETPSVPIKKSRRTRRVSLYINATKLFMDYLVCPNIEFTRFVFALFKNVENVGKNNLHL